MRAAEGRQARVPGVLLVAGALVLGLAGCSSAGSSGPSGAGSGPARASSSPSVSGPVVRVAGDSTAVPFASPVQLAVDGGTFANVLVSAADGGAALDGAVSADATSWVSQGTPRPAGAYQATATVKDGAGRLQTATVRFQVAPVPDSQRVSFTVTPNDGTTVGIGQPVVIRFASPVTERAAMEKVMLVDARTAAGQPVTGSWHWLSASEVHWRPKDFWTPGTTVRLDLHIAGVKASATRYGRKDYAQTFRIGASHVTRVDAAAHQVRVYRDGQLVDTWPGGTGRPGLATYSGTYVVLGKSPSITMDSCSAKITCDKKNPDYYSEKESWATRITMSGTFLHAASWDPLLGKANVSHGCIHLSDADAKTFYDHAVTGDVVIVSNTGRGPQERIATQDPGLYDWNQSWTAWQAGSALH